MSDVFPFYARPDPATIIGAIAPDDRRAIERVELHRIRLPLRTPFVTAHGTEHAREVVLVEIVGDDGVTGWGECSALRHPGYSPEHVDGAWHRLRGDIVPAVLRPGGMAWVGKHPMAWAAVDAALADARAQRAGTSLAEALGGTRTSVPSTAVVGRQDDLDDLVIAVAAHVTAGVGSVKLKVVPGAAVEPVAVVRHAFPDLPVAVDANGSFDPGNSDHRNQLVALADLGPWYVEQPFAPEADDSLIWASRYFDAPVALDESITSIEEILAFGHHARFVLNVKPARLGGLDRARRCAQAAQELGWSCFVGGMLETGVGRAAALAAASWSSCDLPTDLGPSSRYVVEDVTDAIELDDGELAVPAGAGLGVEVHRDRVVAARVDHAVERP